MSRVITVKLPSGFWKEGACYHQAEMRPLSAREHLDLAHALEGILPAHSATALLAHCLARLGPVQPVLPGHVRSLTVGDRESLLLQFHMALDGDRLDSLVTCSACGQAMDVPLSAEALLCEPRNPSQECYEDTFQVGENAVRVRFRAPIGEDQELAAELARTDLHAAEIFLLKRCIIGARLEPASSMAENPLLLDDEQFLTALASGLCQRLAEIDPQAEVILNLSCPSCGHAFQSLFDIGEYIRHDLRRASERVHQDVHLLALHYHWSEKDILELPETRRQAYLRLLADAGRA
jgi:hypothetical protein